MGLTVFSLWSCTPSDSRLAWLITIAWALITLVPTIGRHDTYPALERSVLSYVEHLPEWFPYMRVDMLTEEGCEAAERIDAPAASHPWIRVVTVPKAYQTKNGTRF